MESIKGIPEHLPNPCSFKYTVKGEITSPEAGLTIWFFYLGIQTKRFDNFSNFFLSENYLKTSFK
ncbi:hypothetical protein V2605_02325 [Tenacibaculum maritimum]|uniref:hypothetical protein n=1 Tax=Tenacibaculum maritimum TaxID=107401 RepID=UPI00133103F8|nr:hypothetical protein [Tenacibaculum maritimum]